MIMMPCVLLPGSGATQCAAVCDLCAAAQVPRSRHLVDSHCPRNLTPNLSGISCDLLGSPGVPLDPLRSLGIPWAPLGFLGNPWDPMDTFVTLLRFFFDALLLSTLAKPCLEFYEKKKHIFQTIKFRLRISRKLALQSFFGVPSRSN